MKLDMNLIGCEKFGMMICIETMALIESHLAAHCTCALYTPAMHASQALERPSEKVPGAHEAGNAPMAQNCAGGGQGRWVKDEGRGRDQKPAKQIRGGGLRKAIGRGSFRTEVFLLHAS